MNTYEALETLDLLDKTRALLRDCERGFGAEQPLLSLGLRQAHTNLLAVAKAVEKVEGVSRPLATGPL